MIKYKDKVYHLADFSSAIRTDFCMAVEERDRNTILRFRPFISEEEYQKRMADLLTDVQKGEKYNYFGEYIKSILGTEWAGERLVYLSLKYGNPDKEITPEFAAEFIEAKSEDIDHVIQTRTAAQKADPTKATASATLTS